uniref:RES domain-containing protein n=1 Tax=Parastrongyloides trichosuri TaxID=131310 RepID=A0A0N5A6K2_PARTI
MDGRDIAEAEIIQNIYKLKYKLEVQIDIIEDKEEICENEIFKELLQKKYTCGEVLTNEIKNAMAITNYFDQFVASLDPNFISCFTKHPQYYTSAVQYKGKDGSKVAYCTYFPEGNFEWSNILKLKPSTLLRGHILSIMKAINHGIKNGGKDDHDTIMMEVKIRFLKSLPILCQNEPLFKNTLANVSKNASIYYVACGIQSRNAKGFNVAYAFQSFSDRICIVHSAFQEKLNIDLLKLEGIISCLETAIGMGKEEIIIVYDISVLTHGMKYGWINLNGKEMGYSERYYKIVDFQTKIKTDLVYYNIKKSSISFSFFKTLSAIHYGDDFEMYPIGMEKEDE